MRADRSDDTSTSAAEFERCTQAVNTALNYIREASKNLDYAGQGLWHLKQMKARPGAKTPSTVEDGRRIVKDALRKLIGQAQNVDADYFDGE